MLLCIGEFGEGRPDFGGRRPVLEICNIGNVWQFAILEICNIGNWKSVRISGTEASRGGSWSKKENIFWVAGPGGSGEALASFRAVARRDACTGEDMQHDQAPQPTGHFDRERVNKIRVTEVS